eukprot:483282_1
MSQLVLQKERLDVLHERQRQRRQQQKEDRKLIEQKEDMYQNEMNSMEYIVGITDHMDEVCQIVMLKDTKKYTYGICFDGFDYVSSIFQPSVAVTYENGIYYANIMLSRHLTRFCEWRPGTDYKAHYYTLKSNDPQWSKNFVEDFSIIRVHIIFDILYTLRLKRLSDEGEPVPQPKYKMKRQMRWWMANYLQAWINTLKRLCEEENVIIPPPPISDEHFDMLDNE